MLFLIKSGTNSLKKSIGNFIKKLTSSLGRDQFSVENAYNVRTLTPKSLAAVAIFLTVFMPILWPATRGIKRFLAHLPLPSIIMAI